MLRIATFNCNNLFSRPRIFGVTKTKANQLFDQIDQLNSELQKPIFNQTKIKILKKALSHYITIRDIRGKYDKVAGAADWLGWVELKRNAANEIAIENVASVIHAIDADIVALVEVENRPLLQEFHDKILLKKFFKNDVSKAYDHIYLIDGNDSRGIDVAVMSRRPVNFLKSHITDKTDYFGKTIKTFSRDCFQVNIQIDEFNDLNLFVNHFKSMGYSDSRDPQSEKRRRGQSERVRGIIGQYDLNKDNIIVAGDLNSSPEKWSINPLTESPELYNVNLELPASERGTYRYKTAKNQLDYLLVSKSIKSKIQRVYIERRGTFTKRGPNFLSVTNRKTEASDHGAVVVDLDF